MEDGEKKQIGGGGWRWFSDRKDKYTVYVVFILELFPCVGGPLQCHLGKKPISQECRHVPLGATFRLINLGEIKL